MFTTGGVAIKKEVQREFWMTKIATSKPSEYKGAVYDSFSFAPISEAEIHLYKGGNITNIHAKP